MGEAAKSNFDSVEVEAATSKPVTSGSHKLVDLTMLSWFLADYLPKNLHSLFDEHLVVRPIQEQGWSNYTFEVSGKTGKRYIVRMKARPQANSLLDRNWSAYHKEAWVISNVGKRVPVANVIDETIQYVGRKGAGREYAIMVQEHLECKGGHHLEGKFPNKHFLRRISEICKRVNETETQGYGETFLPGSSSFKYSSWSECLEAWLGDCPIGELVARDEITESQAYFFEQRVYDSLVNLQFSPRLFHGDLLLNWSNALVDPNSGVKGIIDWEFAGSGPADFYELMTALYVMIRDGMVNEDIEANYRIIRSVYGISTARYERDYRHAVDALMMMHVSKKVKRYILAEQAGEMEGCAWRQAFAERARCLLHQLCAGQNAVNLSLAA